MWRTTYAGIEDFTKVEISIHVPRVEDDFVKCGARANYVDFNPRPPCGGRRRQAVPRNSRRVISIHVPRVEDDKTSNHNKAIAVRISIHVPRVEDDFAVLTILQVL